MKFSKFVCAAVFTALTALVFSGPVAQAQPPSPDVSVMAWRVVDGPFPNTPQGRVDCENRAFGYKAEHGRPAGCLLEADQNLLFVWAYFA